MILISQTAAFLLIITTFNLSVVSGTIGRKHKHQEFRTNDYRKSYFGMDDFGRDDFRMDDFRRNDFRLDDFMKDDFRMDDFRTNDFRMNDLKKNDFGRNDFMTNGFRLGDLKENDFGRNHFRMGDLKKIDFGRNDFRMGDMKKNDFGRNDFKKGDFEMDDLKENDFELDDVKKDDFGMDDLKKNDFGPGGIKKNDFGSGGTKKNDFGTNDLRQNDISPQTVEIIQKHGYPVETHRTGTSDGYLLTLHRIPHGKRSKKIGIPILAAHGLFGDSSDFLLHGNKSLGFLLADEGFDVWLVNFRGNNYSRTHAYFSPKNPLFWDFSLHELGVYDLPAHIDYIRNITKKQELLFLGYSMGTTAFLIMASERLDYQRSISGAVLLAPITAMKYTRSPLRALAPFGHIVKVYADINSHGECHIDGSTFKKLTDIACHSKTLKFCESAFYAMAAGTSAIFNEAEMRRRLGRYPSGTSMKVLVHYAQTVKSGKFGMYDYDIFQNKIIYKQKSPPSYRLTYITTPISIFMALNDTFTTPRDIVETLNELPNVKTVFVVPNRDFRHKDFIFGEQNEVILYPEVAKQIKNLIPGNENVQHHNPFKSNRHRSL